MWDTAENSGVLIYVQLVDRRVDEEEYAAAAALLACHAAMMARASSAGCVALAGRRGLRLAALMRGMGPVRCGASSQPQRPGDLARTHRRYPGRIRMNAQNSVYPAAINHHTAPERNPCI